MNMSVGVKTAGFKRERDTGQKKKEQLDLMIASLMSFSSLTLSSQFRFSAGISFQSRFLVFEKSGGRSQ